MNLIIFPTDQLKGYINLPASKSYSIRAFIIAACGGESQIIHPSDCDDAIVSMRAATALGAKIKKKKSNVWHVTGFNPSEPLPSRINVGESGTVLRFLLPLIALRERKIVIDGKGTLKGRPNLFLIEALQKRGVHLKGTGKNGSIPIRFNGGQFKGGAIPINAGLSSQFISALLISCPLLKESSQIHLLGKSQVSTDYITMTTKVLKKSGIRITKKNAKRYSVYGNQRFKGLKSFVVPSDYGLGAYFLVAAALCNSNLTLRGNLKDDLPQADAHILSLLKKMGVKIGKTSKALRIMGPFKVKGGSFSLRKCPDLVPIMTVLALFAKGKTRLHDIAHARVKESDRINDLRKELLKIGAKIKSTNSSLTIYPQEYYKENCILDSHKDHRLAMAFSILGLKVGVRVKDVECCHKSYPRFIHDLKLLGAQLKKT